MENWDYGSKTGAVRITYSAAAGGDGSKVLSPSISAIGGASELTGNLLGKTATKPGAPTTGDYAGIQRELLWSGYTVPTTTTTLTGVIKTAGTVTVKGNYVDATLYSAAEGDVAASCAQPTAANGGGVAAVTSGSCTVTGATWSVKQDGDVFKLDGSGLTEAKTAVKAANPLNIGSISGETVTNASNVVITLSSKSFTYDGRDKKPTVTALSVGETSIGLDQFCTEWPAADNKAVGSKKVRILAKTGSNCEPDGGGDAPKAATQITGTAESGVYTVSAAKLTAAHINLGNYAGAPVTLPMIFDAASSFSPGLKTPDFSAGDGTLGFEFAPEGGGSPITTKNDLVEKVIYAVRATYAYASGENKVHNFLETGTQNKVLLGFIQIGGGNTITDGESAPTPAPRAKVTWPDAPKTAPTYGGTFSLTVPKAVTGTGNIGNVISVRYVDVNGAWEFKEGVDPVKTAMTVKAIKAGYWPLTTIVQTSLTTGKGDDAVTTYYETMNTIWVTVNKKALDAKWIKINGTYTYNGYSQYDLLDYTVSMGTKAEDVLTEITDYENITSPTKLIAADTVQLTIKGVGNFDGTVSAGFRIQRKEITLNIEQSRASDKTYDGKATVDSDQLWLVIDGTVGEDVLARDKDYTISNAKFPSADVTSEAGANVTGTITLADSPLSKNYKLDPTPTSFTFSGVRILEDELDADKHFNYSVPTNHRFTGNRRGIGSVTWKTDFVANGAANFSVEYQYESDNPLVPIPSKPDSTYSGWSTVAPTNAGTYQVRIVVKEIKNFPKGGTVSLDDYEIVEPYKPVISVWEENVDTRKNVTTTLRIVAANPEESPTSEVGTFSYRWFRVTDEGESVISGQSGSTYTFKPANEGEQNFRVEVGYRVSNVQATGYADPASVTVTAYSAPIPVNDAWIEFAPGALDDKIYHGGEQTFNPEQIIVMMKARDAEEEDWEISNEYYNVDYSSAINAGPNAKVVISFIPLAGIPGEGYTGSAEKKFEVKKKVTNGLDFLYQKDGRTYGDSDIVKGANVRPQEGTTGMGPITVFYDGDTTVPLVAGAYSVTASVPEGTNYTATTEPVYVGRYEIRKRDLTAKDLDYSISAVLWDGTAKSIGDVKVKESVGGASFTGEIRIRYGGTYELPADSGSYDITFEILGDANFESGFITDNLPNFNIVTVSIAQSGREVPKGPTSDVGAVAPVKAVSGVFSVGPSPAKAGDKVKFFWSGKAVTGGTILVYASTGELAKKISVSKVTGSELAVWSGASAGTYLAKAVLNGKDGKKEKVSFLFVVR